MTEEIRYKKDGFDLEAGSSRRDYPEDEDDGDGPFDIFRTKSAPVHRLRRWRVSRLHWFISDLILCFFVSTISFVGDRSVIKFLCHFLACNHCFS